MTYCQDMANRVFFLEGAEFAQSPSYVRVEITVKLDCFSLTSSKVHLKMITLPRKGFLEITALTGSGK